MGYIATLFVSILAATQATDTLPAVPAGLDAYAQWGRWPQQRIGVRAYMRSTYDRTGGNRAADASHFLYQESDTFNVPLDVEGRGVLYFVRHNHWHGSPWIYEVDGQRFEVRETSTADPNNPVENSVYIPEDAFPNPLTWTWSITKGADLSWVPIAFEERLRLAYTRTRYGTGYFIYHLIPPGIPCSREIRAWTTDVHPDPAAYAVLAKAGTDIAPKDIPTIAGTLLTTVAPVEVTSLSEGAGVIRALKFAVPRTQVEAFGRGRLRITWDERPLPSVDAPISLFFGAGTLHNPEEKEFLVKALPVNIRYDDDRVLFACYFPMPFFTHARVEVLGIPEPITVEYELRHEPFEGHPEHSGYFHATYRKNHGTPEPGHDNVFLDTRGAEGSEDWTGHFVGTSFIFTKTGRLNTLEGDPRFFFDDSMTPQCYGTGTEEWGGGGDYWGGRTMTLPLAGHPVGVAKREHARDARDLVHSAYRFLLADLMPFGRNAVIRFEHGGENNEKEEYESVAYWYGLPGASLVLTDTLDVGDEASEAAHAYDSPSASAPVTIQSRFEWGPDHMKIGDYEFELYPEQTRTGRSMTGTSEFDVTIRPENHGVLLRRTLDYQYPNQRAEIYVSDSSGDAEWTKAGVWYLAGSNTCVYSNPPEELGATQHEVVTSNRRLRDDEFVIGPDLTRGRSKLRVRIVFTPVDRPLFPGHPVPELAWSELDYKVYAFVTPESP